MNRNFIQLRGFSNAESGRAYYNRFPGDPALDERVREGQQCGACSYFAPLDADWGVCCFRKSRHFTETVFEHFGCNSFTYEGWGAHSFAPTGAPMEGR